MRILGIDPGKTNMGICLIQDDPIYIFKTWKIEIFKNAKKDEKIHQLIQLEIELDCVFKEYKPTVMFHEGIAYCASNGVEESGKVEYIIERTSVNHGVPFTKLANMTIRRFLGISKGEKTKDLMSLAIYKKFGVELPTQDERDAFAIAKCGEAILAGEFQLTAPKKPAKKKIKE
jgi:Holliday junction resolvasome RuvABC endonuclease subunit